MLNTTSSATLKIDSPNAPFAMNPYKDPENNKKIIVR